MATHAHDQDLPGMEDRAIKPLEQAARDYADIRDRRIALNEEEQTLKQRVIKHMKKLGKTVYHFQGTHIEVSTEDKVKVRIPKKSTKADDDDDPLRADEQLRVGAASTH